jgi:biopolymer transport protein ExbB/TolQ
MNDDKHRLRWNRLDLECRLGLRSKKFTGVNFGFSLIIGLLLTGIFYGSLFPFAYRGHELIDMFFHGGAKMRTTIPYYTVLLSCWSLAILLVKWQKIDVQRKALSVDILPSDPNFVLTSATARKILETIYEKVDEPRRFLLFDRIERSISNLKNLGNVSDVANGLKSQADNDESYMISTYTVVKGFIWAIPVLGFIGTVVGLSNSVGAFGSVVAKGAGIEELKASLGDVTSGLATAFETTLIALVAALLVQLFMVFMQHREECFLDECSDYCHKNLIAKLKMAGLLGD